MQKIYTSCISFDACICSKRWSIGISKKKQWVFVSEAVGFQWGSSGFSAPKVHCFGAERPLLRTRKCSPSDSNVLFFCPEDMDSSAKTY